MVYGFLAFRSLFAPLACRLFLMKRQWLGLPCALGFGLPFWHYLVVLRVAKNPLIKYGFFAAAQNDKVQTNALQATCHTEPQRSIHKIKVWICLFKAWIFRFLAKAQNDKRVRRHCEPFLQKAQNDKGFSSLRANFAKICLYFLLARAKCVCLFV